MKPQDTIRRRRFALSAIGLEFDLHFITISMPSPPSPFTTSHETVIEKNNNPFHTAVKNNPMNKKIHSHKE